MNIWKIAFFSLLGLIVTGIIALVLYIDSPKDSGPLPSYERSVRGSVLSIKATKKDLESLANTYIQKAMKGEPLPVTMVIREDVILVSKLTVFGFTLPVIMHFDPVVLEDGNLLLKQSSLEIGDFNFPPSTVLEILRDTIDLPEWMVVRAKEEEIFINLSELPVSGDILIKAKSFNLKEDNIELEVTIPNK
ncbi:YpmS family protein [Sporosarcina highlanderae]|uniref:YpmS family protein n=1 Tax=Sporosarcina highlanderae TaxID=3035916 RepID=A0ABT8JR65_9BACL|nr:YpmS family protein [Sporosarcina highlanderae]MDN4607646.1 YpmS family protein [Sporosarcina highlanderae]